MGSSSSSCQLLPHGAYALLPTVLTTCAWLTSIFQDGCDYATVSGPIVQSMTNDKNVPWLEVGFAAFQKPDFNEETQTWDIAYRGSCIDYNEERMEFDSAWKAAKGFAFLALVLGGGGALFLWFSACCVGYEIDLLDVYKTTAIVC